MNITRLLRKNSKYMIAFTLITFLVGTLFGLFSSYASLFE